MDVGNGPIVVGRMTVVVIAYEMSRAKGMEGWESLYGMEERLGGKDSSGGALSADRRPGRMKRTGKGEGRG